MLNCFDTPSFTFQIRARPIMGIEIQILTRMVSCFNGGYGKISNIIARVKGALYCLILIQGYIGKPSIAKTRPRILKNSQSKFHFSREKAQTENYLPTQFKLSL